MDEVNKRMDALFDFNDDREYHSSQQIRLCPFYLHAQHRQQAVPTLLCSNIFLPFAIKVTTAAMSLIHAAPPFAMPTSSTRKRRTTTSSPLALSPTTMTYNPNMPDFSLNNESFN
ncbi:Nn.00g085660.m01.CDS01 [Neocucurbitaria sp. VM-36]